MGEIADLLIDGTFDYVTGEYIGEGCGYPRTIESNGKSRLHLGYNKSNKVAGVKNYLKRFELNGEDMYKHSVNFVKDSGLSEVNNISWIKLGMIIQDNWVKFVEYTNKHYSINI